MKGKNQDIKAMLFGSVAILFGVLTIFLNLRAYIGFLTLFPGILALLFSFLAYRNVSGKKGLRVFTIIVFIISGFSIIQIFIGELKTKHNNKIEFIDEFSNDLDNKINETQKDSSND